MTAWKRRFFSLAASLSMVGSIAITNATAISEPSNNYNYVPISLDDVRDHARTDWQNAKAAGRISDDAAATFGAQLDNAGSIDQVEKTWAEMEASAQQAKNKHVSIDHLLITFQRQLDKLHPALVPDEAYKFYGDRIKAIWRLKKQYSHINNNFFDFWEFVDLAVDLSSLKERLMRALSDHTPPLETLDELIMRTDNYIARNELTARQLTVYKSFEVEPEVLLNTKHIFWSALTDKAHSRITTPEVRDQLYERLFSIHYERHNSLPSEIDIDKAIVEVQRLIDSGARNGNLKANANVALQHELELVKNIKKSYPGPHPGIDPVERELRMEQVRFMSLDLRFMQDWLGRVLRKDGETVEGREQALRTVRRIDLAYFSGRITHEDMVSLLEGLNDAIMTSNLSSNSPANTENELVHKCRALEGRMDMMISDFSMVPADTTLRLKEIGNQIARLRVDQDQAGAERNRIQRMVADEYALAAPQKYGVSLVAATELEMLRSRVNNLLKHQGIDTPRAL